MTAGQAIGLADAMRPNNQFEEGLKQMWLRQADARLRQAVVDRAECSGFDTVGADRCGEQMDADTVLLAPDAYAALYQHWLCAQMDFALGETARAANEMQLYADDAQGFAAWMRRNYAPAGGVQFGGRRRRHD